MSRFRLALLVPFVAALGGASPCLADALAFVGLSNGQTVIIDSGPGTIVGTIAADGDAIAMMPDGRRIFLSDQGATSVNAVDVATKTVVHTISGVNAPGLGVTLDGTRLYVASVTGNAVEVYNANTYAHMTSMPVQNSPVCIAMSPDGQLAYVSNFNSGSISRVDVPTNTVLSGTVAVGGKPAGMVFHPSLPRAYVSNYADNTVQVIDTAASAVIQTIAVGSGPDAIAVSPSGDRVFAANTVSGTISVIDTVLNSVIATLTTGYPGGASFLADGNAYTLCGSGPAVCVVGTANTITGTIPLPALAYIYGNFIGPTVIAPDAPTAVTGSPGNGNALVSFAQGASDGGLAPNSYTVQVSPGGAEVSGTASPILVTGLTNGNAYTFKVRATNLVGTSAYSTSSGPVTPLTTYTLQVHRIGFGGGSVTGTVPGPTTVITCGIDCIETVNDGTVITLTATPSGSSTFGGWGGWCSGTGGCTVTMDQAKQVTARFDPPQSGNTVDLAIVQSASPSPGAVGKDIVLTMVVTNNSASPATGLNVFNELTGGMTVAWTSPHCSSYLSQVRCSVVDGVLAAGASVVFRAVVRPLAAGSIGASATFFHADTDPVASNDSAAVTVTVNATPAANQVLRYRLYSDVTKEHHFTTDLNEYNTLGSYVGTWVQEGTVGKVLDNPGSFNGVVATPYYRLYNNNTHWHHWTTDINEYYTLVDSPGWSAEGVDGYILPTSTAGATQLYRLNYPYLGALHHWTIDQNEYNTLISTYGWVGEGGAGFVVQ